MPVIQCLDLNITHMKSTDDERLRRYSVDDTGRHRPEGGSLTVDPIGNYGWHINVGAFVNEGELRRQRALDEGFSEEFIAVLAHAASEGLSAVRFDNWAELEPGFPEFDWENGDALVVDEDAPHIDRP